MFKQRWLWSMMILTCENFWFITLDELVVHLITSVQNVVFSELVVTCQNLIRDFANEQLKQFGMEDSEAELRSTSCVSQRDIQVSIISH